MPPRTLNGYFHVTSKYDRQFIALGPLVLVLIEIVLLTNVCGVCKLLFLYNQLLNGRAHQDVFINLNELSSSKNC
jgi:hypothetical protein